LAEKLAVPVTSQDRVISVSIGSSHALALRADGTIVSWGTNGFAQADIPLAARSGVKFIAAGDRFSAVIRTNGSVVVWGDPGWAPSPIPADGLVDVVAVAVGRHQGMSLKRDGTVVTWGSPFLPDNFLQSNLQGQASAVAVSPGGSLVVLGRPNALVANPSENGVTLNWMSQPAGSLLQSSPALGRDELWSPVGATPDPIRSVHRITVPTSAASQNWYRLQLP
jgi:hypothetical protein